MDVKIEKGIQIPAKYHGGIQGLLDSMEVGDSFQLPEEMSLSSVRQAAGNSSRNGHRKYAVRRYEGGHRCWRIA